MVEVPSVSPSPELQLSTRRFVLRSLADFDASEAIAGWTSDPLAAEMLNTALRTWTVEAQKSYIRRFAADKNKLLLGIFPHGQAVPIGAFIISHLAPHGTFSISHFIGDLGWRGRGASSEASDVVMEYFFNMLGFHKAKANVQPQNKAMLWLMLKGAWKKEGHLVKHLRVSGSDQRGDIYAMGLLASDWRTFHTR